MATQTGATTDKGIGFALVFGTLAALGALAMIVDAGGEIAGWGFAAAVTFGTLAVAAIHVYWD